MSTYEKQLRWKKAVTTLSKAAQIREEEEKEKEDNQLHTPQFYNAPNSNDGLAKIISEKSSQNHVARQTKARQGKKDTQDRLLWNSQNKNHINSSQKKLIPPNLDIEKENYNLNFEKSYLDSNVRKNKSENSHSNFSYDDDDVGVDGDNDNTPLIELLEMERKEWQLERVKLIHCIHLQQLELTQRSAAAHDRATGIAKEFSRAIEGFEERLLLVETSVQKEIMAIKMIAESIKAAVSINNTKI
mmetsp:Transcript_34205/g.32606  ORF Transcript_34205/g.32606 Transcript_34205/m.32606 type:complete len:244 (+) Transcript_34205:66-797(+)